MSNVYVTSHADCARLRKERPRKRKLANNTYLEERGDCFAVRLHETNVVTFRSDGAVRLDSGGWLTVTTKDRINRYTPPNVQVWSDRGVWYVTGGGDAVAFADGCIVLPDGRVLNHGPDPKVTEKRRKAVRDYAREFAAKIAAREVGPPGPGDCWGCGMVDADGNAPLGGADHVESHVFEDRYFVPSLAVRATQKYASPAALQWLAHRLRIEQDGEVVPDFPIAGDTLKGQVRKAIAKHCFAELGMAR